MAAPLKARYRLVFNVLKTLRRHMPLLKSWNPLAGYLMTGFEPVAATPGASDHAHGRPARTRNGASTC